MVRAHWKYVIIGGGVAGSAAARAIRQRDIEGNILLVGQEVHRPYNRPPLSKEYLLKHQSAADLFTEPIQWFTANHVELRTGRRAAHLDTIRRSVSLDDGHEVLFDKLLLATGGSPKHLTIPGHHLPNVYYLRNIDDARHLQNAIDKARNEGRPHWRGRGRAAVIGSGLLGVEMAATLNELGLAVDLISPTAEPWAKFAGQATGRLVRRHLENHGLTFHGATVPVRLEGDGRVQRVVLSNGKTLDCDLVVPAIGMVPHKELLRGATLTAEKAILVDSYCRTSQADIFAAGDCAAIFDPLFGKHRLLDHWEAAIATGAVAGNNMAGFAQPYSGISHFSSTVLGLSLRVWGEARLVTRRILRGHQNPDMPTLVELGIDADGKIAQVLALDDGGNDDVLRQLVARRIDVTAQQAILADPANDLAALL